MLRLFLFLWLCPLAAQQPAVEAELRELYQRVMSALKAAKSEDDLDRVVKIMDVREWLSIDPEGMPRTRQQAREELKSLLTVPPEQRIPQMQFFWTHVSAASATAVYWIYYPRKITDQEGTHDALIGALARDTFAQTAEGWRRIRHEKFFPNQVLSVDGRSVITPPLPASRNITP